jgi:hypothetical protein
MAYVPGFEYDVFISYASDEADSRLEGFVQELRLYLRRELGKEFSERGVFFDRQELNLTPVEWKHKLRQSARSAAILLPILTPTYASSDYCAKEWEWFREEHPLSWKAGTGTVYRICPVRWREIDAELLQQVAPEIRSAQEHRTTSAEDVGPKLANALRLMRRSRQTVFVGETEHEVRGRLREEMSRMGFRVMPESAMAYGDPETIRKLLGEARLAVHFAGKQESQRAIEAIRWSRQECPFATVVYEVPGVDLSPEEQFSLAWIEEDLKQAPATDSRAYDRIGGKTFEQFLQVVQDRLESAGPVRPTRIGIACEDLDRATAESIIPAIQNRTGFSVTCHGLSLLDFKKSRGVLFYWGAAKGERLRQARLVTRGMVEAFYLAPPPKPDESEAEMKDCRVLRQSAAQFQVEDIRPFLQELGWRG